MLAIDKKRKFDILARNISRCDLCLRMDGRCKVLSDKNGNLNSKVVFIGEAPGRLGADRTQIPFFGDQTGRNFERLLAGAGLSRTEIFITNTVLCNPRDGNGNNATPTPDEIRNCSLHLSLTLDIVSPTLVVPLGHCALKALNEIEPHSIELNRDVRKPVRWSSYTVLPLYHPGPRAMVHRNGLKQMADMFVVREILEAGYSSRRRVIQKTQLPLLDSEPSLIQSIALHIVERLGPISKFRLTKLLYLLDWQEVKNTGRLLTGSYYILQKNGPLPIGLSKALSYMEGHEVTLRFESREPVYSLGHDVRFDTKLSAEVDAKVNEIICECGHLTDAQIKTRAYLTEPMKAILRRRGNGEKILNRPVFEGWLSKNQASAKDEPLSPIDLWE